MSKKNNEVIDSNVENLMDNRDKVSEVLNYFKKNKLNFSNYGFNGTKSGKCVLNINSDSINFGKMTIQFRNGLVNLVQKLWDNYYVNLSVNSSSNYGINEKGDRKAEKDIATTSVTATLTPKKAVVNDYHFNGNTEVPKEF